VSEVSKRIAAQLQFIVSIGLPALHLRKIDFSEIAILKKYINALLKIPLGESRGFPLAGELARARGDFRLIN
jgi:hypothetical protein